MRVKCVCVCVCVCVRVCVCGVGCACVRACVRVSVYDKIKARSVIAPDRYVALIEEFEAVQPDVVRVTPSADKDELEQEAAAHTPARHSPLDRSVNALDALDRALKRRPPVPTQAGQGRAPRGGAGRTRRGESAAHK